LEHEKANVIRMPQLVDGGDVRMIERREHDRFPLESREAIRRARELRRQNLECDLALELGIARAPDLPHPARAQWSEKLVVRQQHSRSKTHPRPPARIRQCGS